MSGYKGHHGRSLSFRGEDRAIAECVCGWRARSTRWGVVCEILEHFDWADAQESLAAWETEGGAR